MLEAKTSDAWKAIAARGDPDPWLVVDELIFRGKHDAAKGFAEAQPPTFRAKLVAYAAAQRGKPYATSARTCLRKAREAKTPSETVAALQGHDTSRIDVPTLSLRIGRARAWKILGRVDDASREFLDAAKSAEGLGWIEGAVEGFASAGECALQLANARRALRIWNRAISLLEGVGARRAFRAGLISNVGMAHMRAGAPKLALSSHRRALAIQEEIGDDAGLARTHLNLGNLQLSIGSPADALKHLEQAQQISERRKDRVAVAKARGNLGMIRMRLGRFAEARRDLEFAAEVMQEKGDDSGLAGALINLGTLYQYRGALPRALDYFERGQKLAEKAGNKRWVTNALVNLGAASLQMGAYERSLTYSTRALERARAAKNPTAMARALANSGMAHERLGAFAKALTFLEQALELAEQIRNRRGQARILMSIGNAQHQLGAMRKALESFERARKLGRAVGDRISVAGAVSNLSAVHADLGDLDKALELRLRGLELYEKLKDGASIARNLNNLGVLHWRRGAFPEALAAQQRALALHRRAGRAMNVAITLTNIAHVQYCLGKHERALTDGEEAFELAKRLGATRWMNNAARNLTNIHLALGSPEKALATAKLGVEQLPLLIGGLADQEAGAARNNYLPLFEGGLTAAVRLGDADAASFFAERGRAGALLEALGGRGSVASELPTGLRERERRARAEVLAARARIARAQQRGKRKELRAAQKSLDEAHAGLLEVVARIQRAAKSSRDLELVETASAEEIQASLGQGEALVSYAEVADKWIAIVFTATEIRMQQDLARVDLDAISSLARPKELEAAAVARRVAALRKAIVAPLDLVEGISRVFVSPSGALAYVPFSLLLPEREIVCIPSGTAYRILRESQSERGHGILALGNPDYQSERRAETRSDIGSLSALPASEAEVKAVGDVVLLGTRANERELASAIPKRKRWRAVHFACHGLINAERPQLSALVISSDEDNDGFLTVHEAFRMKIPTDLVVLSACETGKGKIYRAEGVIGFTRAFMSAGSPRVLVSLWKVDDAATSALMIKFYELWNPEGGAGLPAARALKKAQEHIAAQPKWKHPYFWAAWQLWGLGD